MIVPMNYWRIDPEDYIEGITCFQPTASKFYEVTGLPTLESYITTLNFVEGQLEINQSDPLYNGLTRLIEWRIDIDDGTTEVPLKQFTIVFQGLADCSETTL